VARHLIRQAKDGSRNPSTSPTSRRDLVLAAIALATGYADRRVALASEAAVKPDLTTSAATSAPIIPQQYLDAPMLAPLVEAGKLPRLADHLPKPPLVIDPKDEGREIGDYGGDLRSLISRVRDLRLITI
jgi:peptide/nickel transport system substrate-binding protein